MELTPVALRRAGGTLPINIEDEMRGRTSITP
jgi:hypothetical protein